MLNPSTNLLSKRMMEISVCLKSMESGMEKFSSTANKLLISRSNFQLSFKTMPTVSHQTPPSELMSLSSVREMLLLLRMKKIGWRSCKEKIKS